ncbi:MAG: hypothetical protein ABIO04_09430 [Ferruginibacter sp.]
MKQFILKHLKLFAGVTASVLFCLLTLSFQDTPFVKAILDNQQVEPLQDTIKKKKNAMTMKEFDRLTEHLDVDIKNQLKEIDLAKIEQQMMANLKELDVEKVMSQVQSSLKQIDTEKILAEVEKELQHINFSEVSAETKAALANAQIGVEKAMSEVKKIDKEKIKTELDHARIEIEKSKHEFQKVNMDRILKEANDGIDKAKTELKQLKQMFTEMEHDGLINLKKGFNIEYKNKSLFIDGVKQPDQVTDKYKKYFKKEHFEITIDKE